ncbi:Pentatricopeptide repeat-containing protein [Camellia lanceoleosa]|uniref:Pentatricopeptide repeat-containing protein n=1 Tax=Camellia lanceoleosa TaxID=1840588 RepID=A0ACC0FYW7_9ERIC|nr:Pentatricopeptide repeat-containing protein [Camellia lanceoleosa]
MRCNSVFPDKYTFPFVLKACGRLGLIEKGLEIHCLSEKLGLEFDVFVQNELISMYFQCGLVEFGRRVFDKVPDLVWDVVTWNSVISGYVHSNCYANALKVFEELLGDGNVRPNQVTMVSALVDMYSKSGDIEKSLEIFHGLTKKDVFSGTAMISGLAMNGQSEKALQFFSQMEL